MNNRLFFSLSPQPIDPVTEKAFLTDPECGALVTFEGWVRNFNDGHEVISLEYQAHPQLAVAEGEGLLKDIAAAYPIAAIRVIHRTGHLEIGDLAVWIGVTAVHRQEAFAACSGVLEELKQRVPIWKKEHYRDSPVVGFPQNQSPPPS